MTKLKSNLLIGGYIVILLTIVTSIFIFRHFRDRIHGSNLSIQQKEAYFMFIPTNSSFDDVCLSLEEAGLQNVVSFRWLAEKMNYKSRVKAGRYRLIDGMSNIEIIRMLRSGRQVPVNVTFNNIRFNHQLAAAVASVLEADENSILELLTDSAFLVENYKMTPQTIMSICIPNTYEFFWNTTAKGFLDRMAKEHDRFWTESRRNKAREAKLTPLQVSILASIVQEETNKESEKPTMAGVYINRLNIGMPLQADPTLKFALGDFTVKRLLNVHKKIESPYNTYNHKGLPPGPICMPSISSIDAVLNYVKHDYLYFCAKADFSGYHSFARTLQQHSQNAAAYHRALNNRKIYK